MTPYTSAANAAARFLGINPDKLDRFKIGFHGGMFSSRCVHRSASPRSMQSLHAREWLVSSKNVSPRAMLALTLSTKSAKNVLGGGGVVVHVNRRSLTIISGTANVNQNEGLVKATSSNSPSLKASPRHLRNAGTRAHTREWQSLTHKDLKNAPSRCGGDARVGGFGPDTQECLAYPKPLRRGRACRGSWARHTKLLRIP